MSRPYLRHCLPVVALRQLPPELLWVQQHWLREPLLAQLHSLPLRPLAELEQQYGMLGQAEAAGRKRKRNTQQAAATDAAAVDPIRDGFITQDDFRRWADRRGALISVQRSSHSFGTAPSGKCCAWFDGLYSRMASKSTRFMVMPALACGT